MAIPRLQILAAIAALLAISALLAFLGNSSSRASHSVTRQATPGACSGIEQTAARLQTAVERLELALTSSTRATGAPVTAISEPAPVSGYQRERCMEVYNRDLRNKDKSPYGWEVMMTPELVDAICDRLAPEISVLEWGTGGSTVLFSGFVKEYWAIEHDKPFGEFVRGELLPKLPGRQREKIHYFVVPNDKPWQGLDRDGSFKQFESYIRLPSGFNKQFDLILIDGRARVECARAAIVLELLKPNGHIIIHDWERRHYHSVLDWYDLVQEVRSSKNGIQLAVLAPKWGVAVPPFSG